ncbi:MAG: site-specific integrase [Bacteroidetes bacterium]|nr:site-specific integrase [Bacteroidota bacterium]
MGLKKAYENAKANLLSDENICRENRDIFREFLVWEERKLKRTNNLAELDNATYKTVSYYIRRFRNVNKWFCNKPWINLTKEDIQKVYDDLEDGVIKNRFGKRYSDRKSYYIKIFKSKPFKLAGKAELAKEIFEFYRPKENLEVNFIEFDDFVKLTAPTKTTLQKLLLWLAWDIGENVGSLLQLRKSDFRRQINPQTNEPEYLIDLRKEILKRSRRARVEITNYTETAELLDIVLPDMRENDSVFNFGHRQSLKFIAHCANVTKIKCTPTGKNPTFKDLRSSMCCHLLKIGWRIEEVNSRLGHSPASLAMVTRYANYLALDRHTPKAKVSDNNIQTMKDNLDHYRQREKLQAFRVEEQQKRIELLEKDRQNTNELVTELIKKIADLQVSLKYKVQEGLKTPMEIVPVHSADRPYRSNP